ncbi:MAG: class I SAM-dependent methyltransferase [Gammaproteobacteria bacterium]|nr:MAG: class I SAM-dependent methyltransferase [Gammaproteobacteria bacterium]
MAEDRKQHWERIYAEKAPEEVSWYQEVPEVSLDLIARYLPRRDAPLIDVGAGASTLVDHLLERGYSHLTVLDIASRALAEAQARLGARAGAVRWVEGDITRCALPGPFALWHDRAVFHFLTEPTDRQAYVEQLERHLSPGGVVIIAAFSPEGPTMCSGLPIVQYDAERLAGELGEAFEHLESRREAHCTPAGKIQHFGYHAFRRLGE